MICVAESVIDTTTPANTPTAMVVVASGATANQYQIGLIAEAAAAPASGDGTTSAARKITMNGKITYLSGAAGNYIYSDKNMIRYAKVASGGALSADYTKGESTNKCDAIFNAAGDCVSAAPTYATAYGKAVTAGGLAMSAATAKKILAYWVKSDGLQLVLVDQATTADATTAGVNNIVRCTYATFATDAGSSCSIVGKITTDVGVNLASMSDVFHPAQTAATTARYTTVVYGMGNLKKDAQVETVAIGLQSRTVTPQTPAPNCKRNGRKYCTKTKTLVKAPAITNTTTNGSTTNTTNTTTKATTTTTSASAPLLASAWAMVGVVAALIAA
jgi:hypothetical protein